MKDSIKKLNLLDCALRLLVHFVSSDPIKYLGFNCQLRQEKLIIVGGEEICIQCFGTRLFNYNLIATSWPVPVCLFLGCPFLFPWSPG